MNAPEPLDFGNKVDVMRWLFALRDCANDLARVAFRATGPAARRLSPAVASKHVRRAFAALDALLGRVAYVLKPMDAADYEAQRRMPRRRVSGTKGGAS